MVRRLLVSLAGCAIMSALVIAASPARAQLIITPTFDSSITGNVNAAAIEATINNAIHTYETTFNNNVDITIKFSDMNSGLGQSQKILYAVQYNAFYTALAGEASSADQLTAIAHLPNQTNNPVTGISQIAMTTANIRAMGIPGSFPQTTFGDGYTGDGEIGLNVGLTNIVGGQYSLMAVTEHEIDEVMGFGSSLNQSFQNFPQPEDLYRYDSSGNRSYTTNTSARSFFSIDGTTDLAQFDNQGDGGDWADWQSNPLPPSVNPKVQDAFATPNSTPTLGVEIRALNVIGYTFPQQSPSNGTPEPGSVATLFGAVFAGAGVLIRRRVNRK